MTGNGYTQRPPGQRHVHPLPEAASLCGHPQEALLGPPHQGPPGSQGQPLPLPRGQFNNSAAPGGRGPRDFIPNACPCCTRCRGQDSSALSQPLAGGPLLSKGVEVTWGAGHSGGLYPDASRTQIDLYAGALFVHICLGWNFYLSTILMLAITALYTIAGQHQASWREGGELTTGWATVPESERSAEPSGRSRGRATFRRSPGQLQSGCAAQLPAPTAHPTPPLGKGQGPGMGQQPPGALEPRPSPLPRTRPSSSLSPQEAWPP